MKKPQWKKILSALIISALLLPILPAFAESYSAIVTSAQLLVYSDAGLTNAVSVLTKDAVVTVQDTKGSVAKISSGTKKGFAKLSGLAKVDDVAKKAIVNTNTYVYEKADVESASAKLAKNTKVYVLATKDAWARIEKGGKVGYVYVSALTIVEDAATAKPTATPTPMENSEITYCNESMRAKTALTVYKSASTVNPLGTLSAGQVVTRTAYSADGWSYIAQGTKKGFVRSDGLVDALSPIGTATAVPTASATTAPTDGGVTTCSLSAVVNREGLPVYQSASLNAKQTGTLTYGELVTVTAYNKEGWARIAQGSKTGFTLLSGLTREEQWNAATVAPTIAPANTTSVPCTVTMDSVIIYKMPSANSDRLGTLYRNAQVNLVMTSGIWAYIECGGNYGYCIAEALTKNSEISAQTVSPDSTFISVQFTATIVYPYAKLYQNASSDAAGVSVTLGKEANVYAYNNSTGWAYIGIDDKKGYMQMQYLNKDSYAALSSGDSGAAVKSMQQALERLGYFDGTPAGNFGTLTTAAVKRFQSAIGMTQTATADQTMLRILYGGYAPASPLLSANLTSGSSGTNVERLQTRLYNLKYLTKASSVDGDYGANTTAAVKLFQSAAGLSVTGSADSNTLKALYANNAPTRSNDNAADSNDSSTSTTSGNEKIELVISTATAQLGKKYVYGATGPTTFDCSGLTQYCFRKVGVSLKRSAQQQGYDTDYQKITSISSLRRGDIVCMNTISDNDLSDHVGIYLGNNQMIHASSGGGKVIISTLASGYYNRVFSWGRRIIN